jgi:hypothetical protein
LGKSAADAALESQDNSAPGQKLMHSDFAAAVSSLAGYPTQLQEKLFRERVAPETRFGTRSFPFAQLSAIVDSSPATARDRGS